MSLSIIQYLCIFIYLFYFVGGNEDCHRISNERHQISLKDFKVTRFEDHKYVMCAAYYCSEFHTILPLELLVHEINTTKDNVNVYIGQKTVTFSDVCRNCTNFKDESLPEQSNSATNVKNCIACPEYEPSKGVIEIHLRLDESSSVNISENECKWDIDFNMSIQEYSCENGLTVNVPTSQHCNISQISLATESEIDCIDTPLIKKVTLNASHSVFIYTFSPNDSKLSHIWNITLDSSESIEISFSPVIKEYLVVYEDDNLLIPKWNIKQCEINRSSISLTPTSRNIYILYRNNDPLTSEAFLHVNISKSCEHLSLENGMVEIESNINITIVHFSCNERYILEGKDSIHCDRVDEKQLPFCISYEMLEKLENEKKNNVSEIELDQSNLATTVADFLSRTELPPDGSGHHPPEDEDTSMDGYEFEKSIVNASMPNHEIKFTRNETYVNGSINSMNSTLTDDLILFSLSALQSNLVVIVVMGSGLVIIVVILVISLVICRNRSVRSGMNRKFDTFQNPIYEKSVVPIPDNDADGDVDIDRDPSQEKIDLGNLSDSTVLE